MEKLVTANVYNSRMEAEVDKSFLRAHNIKSFIEADDAGGTQQFPFQPNASGVLLKVFESDLQKAKELLGK